MVERGIKRFQLTRLLKNLMISTAANIVLALGVLVALSQVGVSLGPLLAGLGVIGFIVGFALQETLGNFASGMMILMYRPFDEGDVVEVSGVLGQVHKMSLVSTVILTPDNQELVIPNNRIWGNVIRNVYAQKNRRVDLEFSISYEDDLRTAEEVFRDVLAGHSAVLTDPAPTVKVHQLAESAVVFAVRPWVKSPDYWDTYWDINREVKLRLVEAGIVIPYPHREVHLVDARPKNAI
jgi:small conductance mechanosensitive channel